MTKSCFIRLLVISTIFLAVIFYIVTHKFDDWVKRPVVEYLVQSYSGEIVPKLNNLKASPQADSLQALVTGFIQHFQAAGDIKINMTQLGGMTDTLAQLIQDGEISPSELNRFSTIVEKYYQYEKSK